MGMFGAALATGIAPCIGLAVQSLHFLRGKNGFSPRRTLPDVRQALGILSLGASSFVLELSSGVVLLTFNMLLLRISGNVGVAAYGVVANIALVVIALFTGVAQGMQPVLSLSLIHISIWRQSSEPMEPPAPLTSTTRPLR